MTLTFRYAYEDFDRSRVGRWPRQWSARREWALLCGFAAAILLLTAGSVYLAVTVSLLWTTVAVLPLFLVFTIVRALLASRGNAAGTPSDWARNPVSQGAVEVELDPAEFRFRTLGTRHFVPWSSIEAVYENAHGFWFALPTFTYLVPRRAFNTDTDAASFAETVAALHGRPPIRSVGGR